MAQQRTVVSPVSEYYDNYPEHTIRISMYISGCRAKFRGHFRRVLEKAHVFLVFSIQSHRIMDWDRGAVMSLAGGGGNTSGAQAGNPSNSSYDLTRRFVSFLRGYREENTYVYRQQLTSHIRRMHLLLEVELRDLTSFDPELGDMVLSKPAQMLPLLENAATQVAKGFGSLVIQIVLKSKSLESMRLRDIQATQVNRLVKVPGIIISASKVRAKCMAITVQCKHCGHMKKLPCPNAFQGVSLPRKCDRIVEQASDGTGILGSVLDEACPKDSYMIVPDKCVYVDQQTLKLQESPEVVPTGEMPRNLLLSCDRYLVDKAPPGTRVSILGISSVFNSGARKQVGAVAIRTPFVRVVGIEVRHCHEYLLELFCTVENNIYLYILLRLMKKERVVREPSLPRAKKKPFMRWHVTRSSMRSSRQALRRPFTAITPSTSRKRLRASWWVDHGSGYPMA
jgi:hypothetical protein